MLILAVLTFSFLMTIYVGGNVYIVLTKMEYNRLREDFIL